ncbi:MAG: NAD(P)H-dependent oxidoreductase [Firmicutes bacterium]|nr:NAD(P)H-dependent oxidoreductase [Bacillota bacterium]
MKKLLFINACIRGDRSRTLRLCKKYISAFLSWHTDYEWTELDLNEMSLIPQTREVLDRRDAFIEAGDFSDPMFDLAKQFMDADHIVIGAPYWDLEFPSLLKIYFERVSVSELTYDFLGDHVDAYTKAERAVYITTAGGYTIGKNYGFEYAQGLFSFLFGINRMDLIMAEGLDIEGADIEGLLKDAMNRAEEIAKE